MKNQQHNNKPNIWLTNFCDSLRIFVSIIMIQIIVIIYSLSFLSFSWDYIRQLSILTMLAHLLGLIILITLCKLRIFFNKISVVKGIILITLFVILITSFIAQFIGKLDLQITFHLLKNEKAINLLNLKLSVSAVLITWALIRYFYIQDQWHRQIQKLSDAKLNALQARIKPHFLFNSLNSIASLISIDDKRAEQAITDFSALMRRTFMHKDKFIRLEQELLWVKQYLAIEKLRLDSRLSYKIDCPDDLKTIKIPVLCLQPLVENAIIHGIATLENGGEITVAVSKEKKMLMILVRNPYKLHHTDDSNGMALANIRERLFLHYGERASMQQKDKNGIFEIKIGVPV